MDTDNNIKDIKKKLANLKRKLKRLEKLRERDFDKEILDVLNDIRRYEHLLKELKGVDML